MHDAIREIHLEEFENAMKQIMANTNNKHRDIEDMLSGQQLIEDEISVKKEIDNQLYEEAREIIVPVDGPLYEEMKNPEEMNPLPMLQEAPDCSSGSLEEKKNAEETKNAEENQVNYKKNAEENQVNYKKNAEENPKLNATAENNNNTNLAQVLSQESIPSFSDSGGTTSLDIPSIITPDQIRAKKIATGKKLLQAFRMTRKTTSLDMPSITTSSLQSGGTPLISPQFVEPSPPTPSLADSTPSFRNPPSTSGGTSADAADNPSISCFHMPLLPPRTGIGVQDTSPPPTASIIPTAESTASSENIANNPDNPDAGFDSSVPVPDNPRKPAPDLWAYVASRG